MKCAQWLIRDNQQMCFPYFFITKKHYTSREDVDADYSPEKTEFCFHPIKPIRESMLKGKLAEKVYSSEREKVYFPRK